MGRQSYMDEMNILKALFEDSEQECLLLVSDSHFKGVNAVDGKGRSVLHIAIAHKFIEVCLRLLSRSDFIQVNAKDQAERTVLHLAAIHDSGEVTRRVLAHPDFVEVNARDLETQKTALLWAATCGHADVVEALLLSPKTDLTVMDTGGSDSYTIAGRRGHFKIAGMILKALEFRGFR